MQMPTDLKAGDILLYFTEDTADKLIAWDEGETGDKLAVGHVEVYAGNGFSWASRNGIGVNLYPFRQDGLVEVRSLVASFDVAAASAYFATVKGAPYGWRDNLADIGIRLGGNGLNCSHFATLITNAGRCPQFDESFPAQEIKPRDFQLSRESVTLWTKEMCDPTPKPPQPDGDEPVQ